MSCNDVLKHYTSNEMLVPWLSCQQLSGIVAFKFKLSNDHYSPRNDGAAIDN